MKIEKWLYKGKEVDVPIFDEEEIETNEETPEFENTIDLKEALNGIGENNE